MPITMVDFDAMQLCYGRKVRLIAKSWLYDSEMDTCLNCGGKWVHFIRFLPNGQAVVSMKNVRYVINAEQIGLAASKQSQLSFRF